VSRWRAARLLSCDLVLGACRGSTETPTITLLNASCDAVLFQADVTHEYRNLATSELVMYLVMSYTETTV
jgi:hypothetical protein